MQRYSWGEILSCYITIHPRRVFSQNPATLCKNWLLEELSNSVLLSLYNEIMFVAASYAWWFSFSGKNESHAHRWRHQTFCTDSAANIPHHWLWPYDHLPLCWAHQSGPDSIRSKTFKFSHCYKDQIMLSYVTSPQQHEFTLLTHCDVRQRWEVREKAIVKCRLKYPEYYILKEYNIPASVCFPTTFQLRVMCLWRHICIFIKIIFGCLCF